MIKDNSDNNKQNNGMIIIDAYIECLEELENLIIGKKFRRVYILGDAGTGKSHLTKEYVIKLFD